MKIFFVETSKTTVSSEGFIQSGITRMTEGREGECDRDGNTGTLSIVLSLSLSLSLFVRLCSSLGRSVLDEAMPRCHEEYNEASVSFRQMHSDSRYASRHLHRFVFRPSFSQRPTDFPRWVCTRPRFLVTYVEKLVNHLPPLPSSFLLFFFFFSSSFSSIFFFRRVRSTFFMRLSNVIDSILKSESWSRWNVVSHSTYGRGT